MVVAQNHLKTFMSGHHSHLTMGQALVERSRDRRPSQIMWRHLPYSRIFTPTSDDLPGLWRRERFIELKGSVVDGGLENKRLRSIGVKIAPPVTIQFQICVDRLF